MTHRVLLAGLFHETHTFLEGTTTLDDFQVRRGDELLEACGDGSPLSGVLEVADGAGWSLIPTIDLRATPSATVVDEVVETFWQAFETTARAALADGIDGIFLVLHGAMAAQTIRDVEGELIDRIRSWTALADVPLCGVLDLHGNISRRTVEPNQGFVAYRENPHIDSREAAVDAARLLDRVMTDGIKPTCVWEHPPIMWPPTGTATASEPMRTLETEARKIERDHPDIAAVNVFAGFSFADTEDTGVSFSAITFGDPSVARKQLRHLCEIAVLNRELGNAVDPPLEELLPQIREQASQCDGPVLIVEPADNIGGGAPGDGTSVLRALLDNKIANSAVVIDDSYAVAQLRECAVGEHARLSIGGRGSSLADGPVDLDVELVSTSDGRFDLEDPNSHLASMSGIHIDMGASTVVRSQGVTILLTSKKTPPFDLGQLRSQGISPEECSVIGVKAAVAHRRAYEKIQSDSFTVGTPGPCSSDLTTFPFENIRRPIFPLDEM